MIDIPKWLNNVAIICKDNDKTLISILQSQFEGYNIEVNPDAALAEYWLIINRINVNQQIISVGASTNPRQYILTLLIEFMLQKRKGQVIQAPNTITVTRQLTINNDRILGSNYEEATLINEMKQDAAVQMINRLSREEKAI